MVVIPRLRKRNMNYTSGFKILNKIRVFQIDYLKDPDKISQQETFSLVLSLKKSCNVLWSFGICFVYCILFRLFQLDMARLDGYVIVYSNFKINRLFKSNSTSLVCSKFYVRVSHRDLS